MDLVVTGANGFIGRGICAALTARGDKVSGVVRRQAALQAVPAGTTPLLLENLCDQADLRRRLPAAQCLIHAAGNASLGGSGRDGGSKPGGPQAEVEMARSLARAAAARGYRRLVFISSIAVLGTSDGGAPFTEATPAAPGWPYARIKLEAEQALLAACKENGVEAVILRPPLVYGPGNRGNFPRLVRWVNSGLPIPLGSAGNARSYLYIDNLAHAAALCARHPGAANRLFLLADAHNWSTPELVRLIAREAQCPARLWPVPLGVLRALGQASGSSHEVDSLINSRRIDAALIHRLTGWTAPCEAEPSLARTVRWSLENPAANVMR
ncbi:MAG: NAD-dependent epimerase/dehydratase [Betaproteobacteria bacterium]|nr:NAD-dependent epimerase/dehydratase [Betaproteobacteria bacterium]